MTIRSEQQLHRTNHNRGQFARLVLTGALLIVGWNAYAGGADPLIGASSGEHIWLILGPEKMPEEQKKRPLLMHHATTMAGPYLRVARELSAEPEEIAAWGDRVWVIFAEDGGGRSVYSLSVRFNPALDQHYYLPVDRLEIVEGLPGKAEIAALTCAAGGPVVLLKEEDSRFGEPGYRLLRLQQRSWDEITLPGELETIRIDALAALGQNGERIGLLGRDTSQPNRLIVLEQTASGRWSRRSIDDTGGVVRSVQRVGTRPAVIAAQSKADSIGINYLRPKSLLALATVDQLRSSWLMLGVDDGLRLIEPVGEDEVSIRSIDDITGELSVASPMTPPPIKPLSWLHMPVLLGLAITVLLIVFLFKPDSGGAVVSLPENITILPIPRRVIALAIDAAPAMAASVLALRADPAELLDWPMWSLNYTQATPAALAALLTILHSTTSEIFWRKTLGKYLLGGRVAQLDGGKPSAAQILVRNLFKLVLIFAPILGIFILLNPHQQRFGDVIARTVVVMDVKRVEQEEENEQ